MKLFHNPRCSKSREALALLQARVAQTGETLDIVDYLQTPPSLAELQTLLTQLGLPARELLRSNEAEYSELALERSTLDEVQLLAAIAAHPRLLQRPIVVRGSRAVIARPAERMLALFEPTPDQAGSDAEAP